MSDNPHAPLAPAERAKLRRNLGRSDVFCLLACTLVGVDGLGTLATHGGAAFTWMLGSMLLFGVPSALLLAELGTAYPYEGGPYVWVRMASGRLAAAVNNVFYWASNPVWLGGALVGTAAGALAVFFGDGHALSTEAMFAFGLPFIWGVVLLAVLATRFARWVLLAGTVARFVLFGVFTVVVVAYGVEHGFHGLGGDSFVPTFSGFTALVPLILFSLVGFEVPSTAGEELRDATADVPKGIRRSLVATAALYGVPLLGMLLVLPLGPGSGLAGFPEAVKQAATVFGGHVSATPGGHVVSTLTGFGAVVGPLMGLLIALVAFTSGLAWIMGSDRALAVSCLDGAGPRWLGRFSGRFGTPVRVNVLSGCVATGVFVATRLVIGGDAQKFFSVALNLAISTTLMSYLLIFPAAWRLRRTRPGDPRPFRAPWVPVLTAVSMVLVLFASVEALFPGLGGGWFSPDNAPGPQWHYDERWTYAAIAGLPLVVFIAIGVGFWAIGARRRRAGEV